MAYIVDCGSTLNLELGTAAFPFKMLDDPIREITNAYGNVPMDVVVNVVSEQQCSIKSG